MNELLFASATSIARLIAQKQLSSEECVRLMLARIAEVNPKLNAVVQLAEERALAEAKAADQTLAHGEAHGPLHGVPMTIKDSTDTAGIITTGGTLGRKGYVPAQDATVVKRLRRAGAIILGKTNTPELTLSFETDNQVYGRTNNPYDLSRTSGGSSGGAAAIVAAGGSPLDIGSDTGGSIRVPAHCCGIVGIRPTSGRVPRTGHIVPYGLGPIDSLTTLGPMARKVEDLSLCLPIISGVDWQDPAIIPMPVTDPESVDLEALRIAFFTDNGIATPTPETIEAVQRTAKLLSAIVATAEEACPAPIARTPEIFDRLWSTYAHSWRQKLLLKAGTIDHIDPAAREKVFPAMSLADVAEEVGRFRSEMLGFMANTDILICPVNAYPAMPHGSEDANMPAFSYTMTFNLTGWPVVVVR
ncbi:MAG: amidase, partial [Caldilineaceae bacterium]|nr:amidase [Caldilineaceae bacterium]